MTDEAWEFVARKTQADNKRLRVDCDQLRTALQNCAATLTAIDDEMVLGPDEAEVLAHARVALAAVSQETPE